MCRVNHRRVEWGISLGITAVILVASMLPAACRAVDIPHDAYRYRAELTRNARLIWGIDAPVATFAAQIHQESRWHEDAVSPAGAQGVAQFMPATAQWIGGAYRALGPGDPMNPAWAIRAMVTYDKHLFGRAAGASPCDRAIKMLWAYNGGEGWVRRDTAAAAQAGRNPLIAREVEPFNAGRRPAAFAENRAYARLILDKREPDYIAAGFGRGLCT